MRCWRSFPGSSAFHCAPVKVGVMVHLLGMPPQRLRSGPSGPRMGHVVLIVALSACAEPGAQDLQPQERAEHVTEGGDGSSGEPASERSLSATAVDPDAHAPQGAEGFEGGGRQVAPSDDALSDDAPSAVLGSGCSLGDAPPPLIDVEWTDLLPGLDAEPASGTLHLSAFAHASAIVSVRLTVDADSQILEYTTMAVALGPGETHVWEVDPHEWPVELDAMQFAVGVQAIAEVEANGLARHRNLAPVWIHSANERLHVYDSTTLIDLYSGGDLHGVVGPVELTPYLQGLGVELVRVGAAQVEVVQETDVE
jgi:hypothetical protein